MDVGGQAFVSVDTSLVGFAGGRSRDRFQRLHRRVVAKDATFYYMCVSTNTWNRAALSSR